MELNTGAGPASLAAQRSRTRSFAASFAMAPDQHQELPHRGKCNSNFQYIPVLPQRNPRKRTRGTRCYRLIGAAKTLLFVVLLADREHRLVVNRHVVGAGILLRLQDDDAPALAHLLAVD